MRNRYTYNAEKDTDKDIDKSTDEAAANGNHMQENQEEGLSEEDAAIYREESDVRKANRRVQSARESEGQTEKTDTENQGAADAASAGSTSYVIRPGDTLYQISMEKYGNMDEVAEICRLNGISEDEIIYPGQIIVLP